MQTKFHNNRTQKHLGYDESLFIFKQYQDNAAKQQPSILDVLNSDKAINPAYKLQSFRDIYNEQINAPFQHCRQYANFLNERNDLSFDRLVNTIFKITISVCAFGAAMYFMRPGSDALEPTLQPVRLTTLDRS